MKSSSFHEKHCGFHENQQFSLGNLINQLIQDKSFSFIVCLGEAMSDDSMKTAAFHENHHFSWKPAVFTEKWWFSLGNLINQLIQDKSFSFIVCLGEAMSDDSMKTAAFHENRTKDHQLPGMVTLCFIIFYIVFYCSLKLNHIQKVKYCNYVLIFNNNTCINMLSEKKIYVLHIIHEMNSKKEISLHELFTNCIVTWSYNEGDFFHNTMTETILLTDASSKSECHLLK